ncbi:MAG: dephospho-CoA kinase [Clostridiales bacterium]|nr:dephospho-CoA kinase [Clostridiales bacterium]
MVIGITGGVGAGKSLVLSVLKERYGAEIILADEVAADLERPGQPGLNGLVEAFGTEILTAEGELDRAAFARRIFRDEETRQRVNRIIHPLAWAAIRRRIRQDSDGLFVVESALFDEESRSICDYLVYVRASQENRIRRLMENRGYTREKCLDMIRRQRSEEAYAGLADYVMDNDGTPEQVEMEIDRMLRTFLWETSPADDVACREGAHEKGKESAAMTVQEYER